MGMTISGRIAAVLLGVLILLATCLFALSSGISTVYFLRAGRMGEAAILSVCLFSAAFLGWMALPLLASPSGGALPLATLRRLGLTSPQLWHLSLFGIAMSPLSALLVALVSGHLLGLVVASDFVPVAFGARLAVYCLFLATAISCSSLIGNALEGFLARRGRARLVTKGVALVAAGSVGLLVSVWLCGGSLASNPLRLTEDSLRWLPAALAAQVIIAAADPAARLGGGVGALALLLAQASLVWWLGSRFTHRLLEEPVLSLRRARPRAERVPRPQRSLTAALLQRELRCLLRSAFGRLLLVMTLLLCVGSRIFYANVTSAKGAFGHGSGLHSAQWIFLICVFCFLQILAIAGNSFGLDARGVFAFRLGSVPMKTILISKNLFFFLLAQAVLAIVLTLTGGGEVEARALSAVVLMLEAFVIASLAFCNWTSAVSPSPIRFGRAAGGADSASSSSQLLFFLWVSGGTALAVPLGWAVRPASSRPVVSALLLATILLALAAYLWSLHWCPKRIETDFERFSAKLLGEVR